ncbi:MRPL21 [Auxenochlorella protothecoides x Auxenochlorella symbiontica]
MSARRATALFTQLVASRSSLSRGVAGMSVHTALNTVITPAAEAVPSAYTLLRERVQEAYTVPPRPVFAVVELAGTQYKVTPNDTIVTERIPGVDVNDRITLDRVLLAGTADATIIGRPVVPGITVTAAVEEQFLDGKVLIFHKRRRKNSRRTKGHRQPLTMLRILDVDGVEGMGDASPAGTQ